MKKKHSSHKSQSPIVAPPVPLLGRALALFHHGRYQEALAVVEGAKPAETENAELLNIAAICASLSGEKAKSELLFRRVLSLTPAYAEVHNNLGIILRELKRYDEAEAFFRQAVSLKPAYAEAHNNLAILYQEQRRYDEADACFCQALSLKPDYADAYYNHGILLLALKRYNEAEACFRQALSHKPDFVEAHYNLGVALKYQGRLNEAEACYQRALKIKPDYATCRLACVMNTLPSVPQSIEASLQAPLAFDQALSDLSKWLACYPSGRISLAAHEGEQPFYLAYRPGDHKERLSRYGDIITAGQKQMPAFPRTPRDRIRLAIVSHHLYRHSVWDVLIRGLIVYLDRKQFEIFLYYTGNEEDEQTAFARTSADAWRDTHSITGLRGWLAALADDEPDVIYYPEVGMEPLASKLASFRLAPLQIAGWGHPITTGLPEIDVFLSGELLEPPDADAHYRERLIRLPGTGCCTAPIDISAEAIPQLSEFLAERPGPVFLIAQMPYKFDPVDDSLFAGIAADVGTSTFILLRHPHYQWAMDQVVARIGNAFREQGLDHDQHLLVLPWLATAQFYGLLDLCDIYLDCPAFSGYTTAWQAQRRGVPIVTLEGKFMRQRLAAGLLRRIGMTETIAASSEEYLAIASRLARECREPGLRLARRQALIDAAPHADNDVSVVRAFEQAVIECLAAKGGTTISVP
jgi:protein O-GlcNAc transferase